MRRKRSEGYKGSNTLCWGCELNDGGCPWSEDFTPVEGWKATKHEAEYRRLGGYSYEVSACPMYRKQDRQLALTDEGARYLAYEIIRQAMTDYRAALLVELKDRIEGTKAAKERIQKGTVVKRAMECEEFFRSPFGRTLLKGLDPEIVISTARSAYLDDLDIPEIYGKDVRAWRKANGLTLDELAMRIGIGQSTLNALELKNKKAHLMLAKKLKGVMNDQGR